MKNNLGYKLDLAAKPQTLTLSAKFAEAANNPDSDEYKLVRQFQHDFPGLTIERRTHKTPTRYKNSDGSVTYCQKNKKLTYKRMERFMSALPNGADYLSAYWNLREKAEAMCASPYSAVIAWFRAQFPEYRKNPLHYLDNQPEVIPFADILEAAKKKAASE